MRIRLYLDEDSMARGLAQALRSRGLDTTTAAEAGLMAHDDLEHLQYAAGQSRVLYTFNAAHFSRLHAELLREGKSHAGIILAPQQRYTFGEQMRRLLTLAVVVSAEEMRNCLEFLSYWSPPKVYEAARPPHGLRAAARELVSGSADQLVSISACQQVSLSAGQLGRRWCGGWARDDTARPAR